MLLEPITHTLKVFSPPPLHSPQLTKYREVLYSELPDRSTSDQEAEKTAMER